MKDATKTGYHGEPLKQKKPKEETATGSKPKPVNEKLDSGHHPGKFRIKY